MVQRTHWKYMVAILLLAFIHTAVGQSKKEPASSIEVLDARLGIAVQDRELIGEATEFVVSSKVYLWLSVANAAMEEVTVTWLHGEASYTTNLTIGGSPWRTWAYKTVAMSGEWTVTVRDASGITLKELNFTVK